MFVIHRVYGGARERDRGGSKRGPSKLMSSDEMGGKASERTILLYETQTSFLYSSFLDSDVSAVQCGADRTSFMSDNETTADSATCVMSADTNCETDNILQA